MQAPEYAARRDYDTALNGNCAAYPCTLSVSELWPGGKVTWASVADRNASLPQFWTMGKNELALDDLLRTVKLDAAITKDHVLDSLWRWGHTCGHCASRCCQLHLTHGQPVGGGATQPVTAPANAASCTSISLAWCRAGDWPSHWHKAASPPGYAGGSRWVAASLWSAFPPPGAAILRLQVGLAWCCLPPAVLRRAVEWKLLQLDSVCEPAAARFKHLLLPQQTLSANPMPRRLPPCNPPSRPVLPAS